MWRNELSCTPTPCRDNTRRKLKKPQLFLRVPIPVLYEHHQTDSPESHCVGTDEEGAAENGVKNGLWKILTYLESVKRRPWSQRRTARWPSPALRWEMRTRTAQRDTRRRPTSLLRNSSQVCPDARTIRRHNWHLHTHYCYGRHHQVYQDKAALMWLHEQ